MKMTNANSDDPRDESLGVEQLPQSELEAASGGESQIDASSPPPEKRSTPSGDASTQTDPPDASDRSTNQFITNDDVDELTL
jgi:hypothetical protein